MRTATGSEDNTVITNNDMAWIGRGDGLQLTHIFNRFPPKGHYLPTGVNNQLWTITEIFPVSLTCLNKECLSLYH